MALNVGDTIEFFSKELPRIRQPRIKYKGLITIVKLTYYVAQTTEGDIMRLPKSKWHIKKV